MKNRTKGVRMDKDYSKYFMPSLNEARKRKTKDTENVHFHLEEEYKNIGTHKKYLIRTYGCQGNSADSEKMAGILEALGFQGVEREEETDILLLNTCAIRENAESRIFGELGRLKKLKRQNPNLLIGLCGCMPQEEKVVKAVIDKYPFVDIVFGTHNIHHLPKYVMDAYFNKERVVEVFSKEGDIVENIPTKREHSKKAWVNIMYGCDEFCTYCIVPYTRGKERSRLPEDILEEVKELVEHGYIEITLLGQNVNAYGKDFVDRVYSFANLLEDLSNTDIKRVRYTTSHPRDFDQDTIDIMAKGKNIMPHLHLPVQSGSNSVLKKMNRKYTKEMYLDKINALKQAVPDISITTDIIVGFPTETEEDFQATLDLVRQADFEGAFTFIFSPREGTPAAKYEDHITDIEKKDRLNRLNKVINEGYLRGNKRFEGKIVEVLVEGVSPKNPDMLSGYTQHNKLVNFPGTIDAIGQLVKVKIEKAYSWHLKGEVI